MVTQMPRPYLTVQILFILDNRTLIKLIKKKYNVVVDKSNSNIDTSTLYFT